MFWIGFVVGCGFGSLGTLLFLLLLGKAIEYGESKND